MIAQLLRLLLLGLFLAVGSLLWLGLMNPQARFCILAALVLLALHPAVLALEFMWSSWANRTDPSPPSTLSQSVTAWWAEVRTAARVFGWEQPIRARRWSDRVTNSPGRPGIVLVHGFFCNRGVWNTWLPRLHALDCPVIAVTLEPPFGPIEENVQTLEAAICRMEQATGCAPLVVGHSMGGLAARAWWVRFGRDGRVRQILTLGTPHHGTLAARFGLGANARQMRTGSAWLSDLRASELRRAPPLTCFYSHCDNIVFPASSACMPGADNRHLEAVGHVSMVEHPAAWQEALHWLHLTDSPPDSPHD